MDLFNKILQTSQRRLHDFTINQGAEAEKGSCSYVALHTIGRQDDINPPEGAFEAEETSFFGWRDFVGFQYPPVNYRSNGKSTI